MFCLDGKNQHKERGKPVLVLLKNFQFQGTFWQHKTTIL
jgi:hypothetical protein